MKVNIEIEIENISVDDYYFSFDYEIKANGKTIGGNYEDSHVWKDEKYRFENDLMNGYAYELVLETCSLYELFN